MVNVAAAILEITLKEYPIDRDRIYLVGVSSGGSGCWDFAARHPEYFAAVAPLASRGGDNAQVNRLRDIPVWAFHCERDELPPIEHVRGTVSALKAAGGNVYLTEIDSESHDCWTTAFNDYHLLEWMLAQQHGKTSISPGSVPLKTRLYDLANRWQWWQIVAQIGIPAVLIAIAWKASRQHRQRMASRLQENRP